MQTKIRAHPGPKAGISAVEVEKEAVEVEVEVKVEAEECRFEAGVVFGLKAA